MISLLNINNQNITLIGDNNIDNGSCSSSYKSNLLNKFVNLNTTDIFIEQSFISKQEELRSDLKQSFMIDSVNSPFNCYDINNILSRYPNIKIHYCDIRWFNNDYDYKNLFEIWINFIKNKNIKKEIPSLENLFKATKIDKQLNKSKYKDEILNYYKPLLHKLINRLENEPKESNVIINLLMDIYLISRVTRYFGNEETGNIYPSNVIIVTSLSHMREINKFFESL